MIIPIGHEKSTVRRLPWVSISIIGVCVAVFLLTYPAARGREQRLNQSFEALITYYFEHPYLELNTRFRNLFFEGFDEKDATEAAEMLRRFKEMAPENERAIDSEQETLDRLVDGFFAIWDDDVFRAWGLVPADLAPTTLLTYQFLHGGWFHLFGNLFFLFVTGPFIEDVWGRPIFAAFYVLAGGFAGIMYAIRYPSLEAPLIGASGAVAAVMGAFVVRFLRAKMRFFLLLFVPLGPFRAPAWIVLPAWFLMQLASAQISDVVMPGAGGGGVAYWAHVWGFVFGVVVAATLVYTDFESRFIDPTIESKVTLVDNTTIEDALDMAADGRSQLAVEALARVLERNPEDIDAAMALWSICVKQGDPTPAAPHMVRAVMAAARRGDSGFVVANWEEVIAAVQTVEIDSRHGVRIAELLEAEGHSESALYTLKMIQDAIDDSTPIAVAARAARLAIRLDAPDIRPIFETLLARDDVPNELRSELAEHLEQLAPHEEPTDRDSIDPHLLEEEESSTEPARERSLQVVEAVPKDLGGRVLTIDAGSGDKRLDLAQIRAISVGGIQRSGRRPVIVIDLLLDSPWDTVECVRAVRLTSDGFDPRVLVGGTNPIEALRHLLDLLLTASEAVPLPGPDAARGKPFRSFASIEEYQRESLGIRKDAG